MREQNKKQLVIGIGNEGRGDDGLGWRFAEKVEALALPNVDVEYRFQLQVEDAELIAQYDTVIFSDATLEAFEIGFHFEFCQRTPPGFIASHNQSPEVLLSLSQMLYKKLPRAFIMKICGDRWEMGVGLSKEATTNLENAFNFFLPELRKTIS